MDDQGATEFPFAIRDVISTATPQELKEAMATQVVTVSRMAGADGQDEFWCAQLMQPVQRRIEMVDRARFDADYRRMDTPGARPGSTPRRRVGATRRLRRLGGRQHSR